MERPTKEIRLLPEFFEAFGDKARILRLKPLPGLKPVDYRVIAKMKPELAKKIFAKFDLYVVPKEGQF